MTSWYTRTDRTKVTWNTDVVNNVATRDILKIVKLDGQQYGTVYLWRVTGQTVSASELFAAQAEQSGDAVPTARASESGNVPSDYLTKTDARATYQQVWRPNTAYLAGAKVLSPAGQIVSRKADGTSGATYDPTAWTAVDDAIYGPGGTAGNLGQTQGDARYVQPTATGRDALAATTADPLRAWYTALGNRDVTPARIWCIGDSITEGQGATNIALRWIDRFRDRLRTSFPTAGAPGGVGYLPTFMTGQTSFTSPCALSGTVTNDQSRGLKRYAVVMGSGATATFANVSGSSFRVAYANNSTVNITVAVDGSTVGTISSSGSSVNEVLSASFPLSAGAHSIVLTANVANCYVNGLYVYNGDETKGIQVYDGGHYGWRATNWAAAPTNQFATAASAIGSFGLVTIALGTNDFGGGVTKAAYKAAMQTIITVVRNALGNTPGPSFLLVMYPQRGDVASPPVPWSDFVAAAREIAAEDTLKAVAVVDLSQRMRNPGVDNSLGQFAGDLVHPLAPGHGVIADGVLAAVTPR